MKLWLRIDADSPRDPRMGKVGRQVGLSPRHAFGMVVAVWCAMGEHAPDGDLSDVDDALIEEWAGWMPAPRKPAGTFARAFRDAFCDDAGTATEYAAQQGALVLRMEKDRNRHRGGDSPEPLGNGEGDSEEIPRKKRGKSNGITERNGTEPKDKIKRGSASGEAVPKPKPEKPPSGLDVLPKADCDDLFELWTAKRGVIAYGRFRKAVLLLFQSELTRYTTPEISDAIIAYAEWVEEQPDKEQGFCTLERFVAETPKWVRFGKMPYVEGGEMTERGQWAGSRELREESLARRGS